MPGSNLYVHHIGRIVAVLVYIESHLDEELSLDEMARIARISPFYFHRLFHAYMGETLAEHVKRLRLFHAAERLQFSDVPITDIAFNSGYESSSSFTKVFNQVMGTSPRQYRKAMQPLVRGILQRTDPGARDEALCKPEYVNRKEETILFVRRIGDYQETPAIASQALMAFLHEEKVNPEEIKAYYSIAHDAPQIAGRSKCRFDSCVSLRKPVTPKGEVGQKTLPAGHFAVFNHRGPYSQIERAFEEIFRFWYPITQERIADSIFFCEHIRKWDIFIPDEEKLTKLYIPLET